MRLVSAPPLHGQGITHKIQEEIAKQGTKIDETDAGMPLRGLLALGRAK